MKKLKSLSVKSLSVLLAVLIALFSLPLTAFAVSFEQTPPSSGENSVTKKEIIELRELRDANTKHFRLEDGTFYAAQYDSAVHYLDENGEWQDIDNTLSESGDTYATNDQKIKFAKKTNGSGEIFTLHDGNRKLTLTLQGANKKISGIVTNNETEFSDGTSKITKMTTLDKISASILYADILENTDLEYVVNSGNIKENIIVKAKADSYSYVFSLSLNNLTAEMTENGEIEICDPSTGELAYRIPAPFMCDASGEYSSNVTLALESSGGNGKYILAVTADAEWINSDGREFPVTIDPPIIKGQGSEAIECTYIDSNNPNSSYGSYTTATVGSTTRAYWKTSSLPAIPASAYITDARFTVTLNISNSSYGYIGVYDVYSEWDESSLNYSAYEDGGLGVLSSNFTDFAYVRGGSSAPYDIDYTFNVTPIVKDWYNVENNGLALIPVSGHTFTGSATLYTDDYYISSNRPTLTVSYRDMKGLESYWTAIGQDAGFAGSTGVNLTNGNLVLSVPTLTSTDALMPISPALVYNSRLSAATNTYTANGFKLNLCEAVTYCGTYTDADGLVRSYYMWTDGDGTDHYFLETGTDGVYADEDGLLLTLNVTSSGFTVTDDADNVRTFNTAGYLTRITDKMGNRVDFGLNGSNLPTAVKMTPVGANSQTAEQLVFGYNGSRLNLVRNPASGEGVIFKYTSVSGGYRLSQVYRVHSPSNAATATEWANFANGTSVTSKISIDATAYYTYDSSGRITAIQNALSDYMLTYSYDTSGRVISVSESTTDYTGQSIGITYGTSNAVVRTSGGDDVYGNTDDLLTTYVFDDNGRAVSTYATDTSGTTLHGAASAQYVGEDNEKAKNSLKQSVSVSNQSSNYVVNGGFENSTNYWTLFGNASLGSSGYAHTGFGTVKLSATPSSNSSMLRQTVSLKKGEYTLSMYMYTEGLENVEMYIKAISSDATYTERVSISKSSGAYMYTFASLDFESIPASTNGTVAYTISIELIGSPSSEQIVYVDDVMLSQNTGSSDFDGVAFGHFESVSSATSAASYWKKSVNGVESNITTVNSGTLFGNVLKLDKGINDSAYAYQTVYKADDNTLQNYDRGYYYPRKALKYTVSGWAKSLSASFGDSSEFGLKVVVSYYNGSNELLKDEHCIYFESGISGWQFINGTFDIDNSYGMVESITLYVMYNNNGSDAYFDNIAIVSGEGTTQTYSYNEKGYVSTAEYGKTKTWNKYDESGEKIIKTWSTDKTIVEYTYTDFDSVETEKHSTYTERAAWDTGELDEDSVITEEYFVEYSYSENGLLTETLIKESENGESISKITTAYSTSPRTFGVVTGETDTLGNTTSYFYDQNNGRLLAVIYPDGNGTCYTYDGIGNIDRIDLATASSSGYSSMLGEEPENNKWVDYTYGYDQRLSKIQTSTTTYDFTYDEFGNSKGVSAGGQTLASYTYNANNGKISEITYGNGFKVKYLYDDLDRISEMLYNNGSGYETVAKYKYDNGGRLYSFTDCTTDEVTLYRYDPAGKLVGTVLYDSTTYRDLYVNRYVYDEESRLTELWEDFTYYASSSLVRETNAYQYLYNLDGSLSNFHIYSDDDFRVDVSYSYDTLGKATEKVLQFRNNNTNVFYGKLTYQYKSGTNGESGLISQYKFERGLSNGTLGTTVYNYTYDANGNITKITDASNVTQYRYEYDAAGQLTREDNRALGKSYEWTYDKAGNILSKKTYAFTVGTLGTPQSTQTYTYAGGTWKDRLTHANGWSYTYDAIGNLTEKIADDTSVSYEYTWEGRNLVKIQCFWYEDGILIYDDEYASFEYNADGIRTAVNSSYIRSRDFLLDGTTVVKEDLSGGTFIYVYDESGAPIGIKYRTSSYAANDFDCYFYEKNLQGDIVAIYREDGVKIASYVYDAWGNFTKTQTSGVTYSTADTFVYNNNPFTYRGYYYDSELGWYYLQTRYYDPGLGRFISSDTAGALTATPTELTDKNLYSYCDSNPITRVDDGGMFWGTITGAVFGGIFGGVAAAINGDNIWAGIGIGAATGAIAGLAVDLSVATCGAAGVAIAAIGGALASSINYAATEIVNDRNIDIGRLATEATIGAAFNLLSFGVGGGTLVKATGSIWKNVSKNFMSTLFSNTTRMVAGKEIMKSAYGVLKNVAKNIGEQFAMTGIISSGQFGFSTAISQWGN